MNDAFSKTKAALALLVERVKAGVVQDAPADCALCEFDCRRRQCTFGQWATCERRLQKGAGELMPRRGSHTN